MPDTTTASETPSPEAAPSPRRWWIVAPLALLAPIAACLHVDRPRAAAAVLAALVAQSVAATTGLGGALARPVGGILFAAFGIALLLAVLVGCLVVTRRPAVGPRSRWSRWWVCLLGAVAGIMVNEAPGLLGFARAIRSFSIPSESMEPTLLRGDRLIADMRAWSDRPPTRGEVVVFRTAEDPETIRIARIAGLPGEMVSVRDGLPVIDGRPAEILRLAEPDPQGRRARDLAVGPERTTWTTLAPLDRPTRPSDTVTLAKDSYFLMGDQVDRALDSRFIGPITRGDLLGRAIWIYWGEDVARIGTRLDEPSPR